jgi:hypothetical protein
MAYAQEEESNENAVKSLREKIEARKKEVAFKKSVCGGCYCFDFSHTVAGCG